jgi:hypothetical protein
MYGPLCFAATGGITTGAATMTRVRKPKGTVPEERAFVEQWWQQKFSMTNLPRLDEDVIMFAHVLELLTAYQGAAAIKQMTTLSAKHWLDGWWLRKFEANPPKHGSVLSLADAERLLIEFRKSTTQPRGEKS